MTTISRATRKGKELWFQQDEYVARVRRAQAELRDRNLDVLISFHPESTTYLTGFYTAGYLLFQLVILPVDGAPTVVYRDVEQYHLDRTYAFTDAFAWSDGDDHASVTIAALKPIIGSSARIAFEPGVHLTLSVLSRLRQELAGSSFVDVGPLIAQLREIKSPAEIAYLRRAGQIADLGVAAAVAATRPGISERDLALSISSAMVRAGSDHCEPGAVASGERAGRVHTRYADRVVLAHDLVNIEVNPQVRHHYARCLRPIKVGRATADEKRLAAKLIEIQDRALETVRPGTFAAVPDSIYRDGFLEIGAHLSPPLEHMDHYPNQTFYSLGFLLNPTQTLHSAVPGCTWQFEAGMTFHTYYLVDSLPFSETILVTGAGYERLTNAPRQLLEST